MLPLILYAANNCIGLSFAMHRHGRLPDNSRQIFLVHTEDVHAPRLLVTRPHRLYINHVVRRDHSSPGRTKSTSTTSCAATTRRPVAPALLRLRRAFERAILMLDFSSVGRTISRRAPNHSVSRLDYFVHHRSTCCPVALALLQPRRASRLLVSRQHRL
jgi:hypothetical protein